jgi:hypothetical protein
MKRCDRAVMMSNVTVKRGSDAAVSEWKTVASRAITVNVSQ